MPHTLDQEKFLLEAYFRSGERDPNGQWKYSTRSCINDLTTEFPDIDLDYESLSRHVLRTVERFRNTGSVAKGKSSGRRTVLNEEVVEDIRVRLDQSPRKPLRQLAQQTEAANAGVTQVSGYIFSSTTPSITRNHYIEKLVPIYRAATEEELQLCPGNWKYGSFYTTVLTECGLYLPWAMKQFAKYGGKFVDRKLESFADLSSEYDLIINCTGLGAKYLCNDNKVAPIRGQVFKVKAPWIKTFFYADYDTYVIPGFNSVTLGGCRQYDSYNLNVDKYDSLSIKERCEAFLPSLKGAEVVGERVGLRPHRDPVRIEKEIITVNGKRMKIVHNYGHGGYGVTVAPGTSIYAAKLAKELLMGNSKL
ncbi:d-amino acid oxidase [Holotrichia oblita]|uniref:D-amino acid oxidase n=1 Tax=Holotrichia oblita TaxID=644536 RepID=A0ACB9TT76_HOLOL|nr:d-amino acid oxidase [Holotrichia oblita]